MIEIIALFVFLIIQFIMLIHQGNMQRELIQSFLDYQLDLQLQLEMMVQEVRK